MTPDEPCPLCHDTQPTLDECLAAYSPPSSAHTPSSAPPSDPGTWQPKRPVPTH